ncbi:hypothetical protein RMR21_015560 [Agrobacterium sp. rho-8.1]|nr:hypothetical protein [Agrobacterium sp. rho-8.1]
MSNRNDEVFAEYMVRLAKKMIEREDQREEEREAANAALSAAKLAMTQIAMTTQTTSVATKIAALALIPPQFVRLVSANEQNVTHDEMAVIRAYFNGEDVLTTILSQTR